MKKSKNIALITAVFLIVSGLVISFIAYWRAGFDFSKLSTPVYENTYTVDEEFSSIRVKELDSNIRFMPLEIDAEDDVYDVDETCMIVCNEEKNVTHKVDVVNGTLVIEEVDNREWYEHIGFFTEDADMVIYLTESSYEKLEISASSGDVVLGEEFGYDDIDITLSSGSVDINSVSIIESLTVETSSGNINVKDTLPEDIYIKTSSGSITVENVSVTTADIITQSGDISIKSSAAEEVRMETSSGEIMADQLLVLGMLKVFSHSGDIDLIDSDAESMYIRTTSGDVTGSIFSDKIFVCETESGDINVPASADGGKCEVKTSSGDIEFDVTYETWHDWHD